MEWFVLIMKSLAAFGGTKAGLSIAGGLGLVLLLQRTGQGMKSFFDAQLEDKSKLNQELIRELQESRTQLNMLITNHLAHMQDKQLEMVQVMSHLVDQVKTGFSEQGKKLDHLGVQHENITRDILQQ